MSPKGDFGLKARLLLSLRPLWTFFGLALITLGIPTALLPTHIGAVLLMVGLIVVLRNSIAWRRRFIVLQRRYPRFVYPLRRLLRWEVWPVIWHETLRMERYWLPQSWRRLRRWRRGFGKRRG